jgi:hypothetical protein
LSAFFKRRLQASNHRSGPQKAAGEKNLLHRPVDEIGSVMAVTICFAIRFTPIMVLKQFLLAEHGIALRGISTATIIALATAKLVVVLRKMPLSRI